MERGYNKHTPLNWLDICFPMQTDTFTKLACFLGSFLQLALDNCKLDGKVIQDSSALVHSHCIAALPDSNLQLIRNAVVKALIYFFKYSIIIFCICSLNNFNHTLADSILAANSVTKNHLVVSFLLPSFNSGQKVP